MPVVNKPQTLFDKVWAAHEVVPESVDSPAVLYIDTHFIHEVSSPVAFVQLRSRGLRVRRPDRTLATLDHSTPTLPPRPFESRRVSAMDAAARQVHQMELNTQHFGVELFDMKDARRGIVHVIGPELGVTQPGNTIVCGDSHTSTHGAFGALAFGIGTTEVAHVLATQCLLQRKPKVLEIRVDGRMNSGVSAKDLILAIIGRIGVGGATGHIIEYRGSAIRGLSMEERMTVCNMSIEAGARAGMIAPDDTTFAYLDGRPRSLRGVQWQRAVDRWRYLPTDAAAEFASSVLLDASALEPMITYGTNPAMVLPITGSIPDRSGDLAFDRALHYMGFRRGDAMLGKPVDVVFIGSCTNGRLEDLRAAAQVLRGRKVARGVHLLIVPGSQQVKREAEAAGLHELFVTAGADWRESGCSMCLGMNGDTVASGKYSVSTSNRNFEGRQGRGARTLLASPLTAAASAVNGVISDPRLFI